MTTIDAQGTGRVVACVSGERQDTVLDGFTITGGDLGINASGAGMRIDGSSPTVTNCTFTGNTGGSGGGMLNVESSATVTNCTFSDNSAAFFGGGMWNGLSNPTVTNCTFSGNTAGSGGGGMSNLNSSYPTVTNCTFSGNSSRAAGGGMNNSGGSAPKVTNCTFSGNSADVRGGGMYNVASSPTVTNCSFNANSANGGGGMYNYGSSSTVTNCTFALNAATNGNALAFNFDPSELAMANCILRDGGDEISNIDGSTVAITYTDVQGGGWPGTGNIDADPLFVDPGNGDYRLSPASPCIDAGHNWGVPPDTADVDDDGDVRELTPLDLDGNPRFADDPATADTGCGVPIPFAVDMGAYEFPGMPAPNSIYRGDLRLSAGSPAIDAAHNWFVPPDTADVDDDRDVRELTSLDLDGNPRFADDPAAVDTGCGVPAIVDMGAYEFQGVPAPNPIYLGDLDADRVVGIVDFLALLAAWGPCNEDCCIADVDLDDVVGITDFLLLLGTWG